MGMKSEVERVGLRHEPPRLSRGRAGVCGTAGLTRPGTGIVRAICLHCQPIVAARLTPSSVRFDGMGDDNRNQLGEPASVQHSFDKYRAWYPDNQVIELAIGRALYSIAARLRLR